MRPKKWSYTPSDNNLTGFASNVTGATFTLSATTVGDGLAHQVTVRNDAAVDHSGKTIVLVGTDADGRALTETLTGPGVSATVTSAAFFKTLTSATPSATIGADTFDIGWNDVAVSPTFPLNYKQEPANIDLAVDISGTISVTVQHCLEPLQSLSRSVSAPVASTLTWWNHEVITSVTADTQSNTSVPVTAVRLKINSLTTGATVAMHVVQGR